MNKLFVIILASLLIFGCISPTLEQSTFEDFNFLKEKYEVTQAFSVNTIIMNDYISELSIMRSKSSFNLAAVIDAEIPSAKAFYYYSLANQNIRLISINNCSENDKLTIRQNLNLAISNSNLAINKINSLLFIENSNLRENQKEVLEEIKTNSENALIELNSFC